ncbi:ATP-binding protein [Streptomyces sp. NPDC059788]|uniref:ATP-binding protein n=1 Tax=Streptomyces sp. NPDC059788 TaxID=3346948 RepID=UPI00366684CA
MHKPRIHRPAAPVGRDAAAAALETRLRAQRLVTVTGPGGMGKSALAAEVAYRMAAAGRWAAVGFGDLAALDDPGLLPHHLARALRLDGDPARPQLDALARTVGTRPVLLVVDTCERLADACAEVFARLVAECPGAHVLATSRVAPGAPDGAFPLRPLTLDAATTLFRAEARQFGAEDIGPGPAREICRLLDGLPLAVRTVAARLVRQAAADLLAGLSRPEYVLDLPAPVPGLPERLRTLRGSLRWSLRLCTPLERLLWARCSVFPSVFTAHDAGVVCGDERLPPGALAAAFAGLERHALILREREREGMPGPEREGLPGPEPEPGPEPVRTAASPTYPAPGPPFRMPRGTRAYGRQWLVELGEERELLRRCLAWSLDHG